MEKNIYRHSNKHPNKLTIDEWYEINKNDVNNIINNIRYYLEYNKLIYILDKPDWEYSMIKLLYKNSSKYKY